MNNGKRHLEKQVDNLVGMEHERLRFLVNCKLEFLKLIREEGIGNKIIHAFTAIIFFCFYVCKTLVLCFCFSKSLILIAILYVKGIFKKKHSDHSFSILGIGCVICCVVMILIMMVMIGVSYGFI